MGHDYSTGCSCLDTDGSHTIFLRQMFVGESENCWISKMDVSILHVSTCDHSCKILALNFDTYIASYIPRIMTFEQCQGDLGIKNPSVNHSSKCCSECFIYYCTSFDQNTWQLPKDPFFVPLPSAQSHRLGGHSTEVHSGHRVAQHPWWGPR